MVLAKLAVTIRASVRGEGIAVSKYKYFCPICKIPDTNKAPCRCDQPTQAQLIELLRTIYVDAETTERIKRLIEELFRP